MKSRIIAILGAGLLALSACTVSPATSTPAPAPTTVVEPTAAPTEVTAAPAPPPTEELVMLRANPWQWVSFTSPVETFEVETPDNYTVEFNTDASLTIKADCNNAAGSYQGEGGKLTVEIGPMTAAACPPESRSDQFVKLLGSGALYFFRDGNLYIDLFADGGTMVFAPAASTPSEATTTVEASNIPRLRALDFTPFEEELAAFTPERAAAVDAIVNDADIAQVQDAVKAGKLTYAELTLYFLARIQQYDETLRTMIELNPDALKEAQAADQRLKDGTATGLMLGIPVTLKDNIETTAPLHTAGGSEILLNHVPDVDASFVQQLRAAGAVILGKANLSELAGGVTIMPPGASAVGGVTMNPHGDFSAGGSSSGSGASTAAYLTMVSVGSETAGSLIVPASWNGVVGMYPGKGVVDGANVIPLIKNNDSAGPIGRQVADVAALLGVIDTLDVDYVAGLDATALDGVNAGFFKADVLAHPTSALEDTADNAAIAQLIETSLAGAGATVTAIELTPPGIGGQIDGGLGLLIGGGVRHDMTPYLAAAGAPIATLEELAAYNLADPNTRIPFGQSSIDAALANAVTQEADAYQSLVGEIKAAAITALDAAFAESSADVLVSVNNYHSSLYATANYPAISVPLGLRANGMPVGVTLIGRPGEEAKLLSYAYALEQATKLRVNPILAGAPLEDATSQQRDTAAADPVQPAPDYVTALEAAYGAPSQEAFGSAVFYEQLKAADVLEQAALAKYKYFVGDLWERYGEDAWMGPWKAVYTRPADGKRDIIAELRGITDREARMSVEMILDNVDDPEKARAALSAAFDDSAVTELAVYNTGDSAAMSGLLVAGRRGETGATTFLVFLMD